MLELLSGQDPARGRKRAFRAIAVTCVVALVSIVGGFEVSHWLENRHSQGDAKRDDHNADVIEDAKKPFDWKMNPGLSDEEPWTSWVLDRRLTPKEQAELKGLRADRKAILAFVKKRGGWRVGMEADSYKLQLTSEKQKAVVVTQLSARAVSCRPSPLHAGTMAYPPLRRGRALCPRHSSRALSGTWEASSSASRWLGGTTTDLSASRSRHRVRSRASKWRQEFAAWLQSLVRWGATPIQFCL
ncbi:hypothetical protein OG698_01390 [Streptomyces sp. NBC_01003]|uniref:hypothetical protein n=1 Tax=Streptomyces sp. NBC_01003 TaxID=2903714 RepID=UPI0038644218|nr:hypothetical protein OG698_01390 [Streptomyces sp. NBC_01003]